MRLGDVNKAANISFCRFAFDEFKSACHNILAGRSWLWADCLERWFLWVDWFEIS